MERLNYFKPYESKPDWYEDQLTRAFLVVLRYSPVVLCMFYDYISQTINYISKLKEKPVELPALSLLDFTEVEYATQVSDLKPYLKNKLLSVLITDEGFNAKGEVNKRGSLARYDGVITFSNDLTIIIENKPRSYNVWEEQLSPSLKDVLEETHIISLASILEWKQIIGHLNNLLKLPSVSGAEGILIRDFLDYIDTNFPYLNPYDDLSLCKNNYELMVRRSKNILLKVAAKEESVKYHQRWRSYYIETGFDEIRMVGLRVGTQDSGEWNLELSLYFGDTLNQSRSFYRHQISFQKIRQLVEEGWSYIPNFHISHIQTHLLWFETPIKNHEEYYNYWLRNQGTNKQYSKDDLLIFIDQLASLGLIDVNLELEEQLQKEVINSNRNYFNICPGIGLLYRFTAPRAIELDVKKQLVQEMKKLIYSGLGILPQKIEFLK